MNAFIHHMFQHSPIYRDKDNNICCARTHIILLGADADLDSPQTAVTLAQKIIDVSRQLAPSGEGPLGASSPTRLSAQPQPVAVLPPDEEKNQEVQIVFVPMPSSAARPAAPAPDPAMQVYFQHIDFTLFQLSQAQPRQHRSAAWVQRIGLFLRFIKLQFIILFQLRPVSLYELQQPKKTGIKALYDVRTWSRADDRNLLDSVIGFFASKVNLLGQAEAAIWRTLGYSYMTAPPAVAIPDNALPSALLVPADPFTEPLMPRQRAPFGRGRSQIHYRHLCSPPGPASWNAAAELEAFHRSNQP